MHDSSLWLTVVLLRVKPDLHLHLADEGLWLPTCQLVCCQNLLPVHHLIENMAITKKKEKKRSIKSFNCSNEKKEKHYVLHILFLASLPIVHPYTVSTPVRRASDLPSTRFTNVSLRLLCMWDTGELLAVTDRTLWGDGVSDEPGCSKLRVAAICKSFRL